MPSPSQRNAEYGYPSNYSPPRNMLAKMAQDIEVRRQMGNPQVPQDIAYGEQGLEAPRVYGVSIDPTDYLGPGLLKTFGGALIAKVGAAKALPMMAGMMSSKGDDMARLISEAQAQIEAENAAKNALNYKPANNQVRNALVGIGAGGAGLAGGYYGTDYLSK